MVDAIALLLCAEQLALLRRERDREPADERIGEPLLEIEELVLFTHDLRRLYDLARLDADDTRIDAHVGLHGDERAGDDVFGAEQLPRLNRGGGVVVLRSLRVLLLEHVLKVLALDELNVLHRRKVGDHHRGHAAPQVVVVAASGVVVEVEHRDPFRRRRGRGWNDLRALQHSSGEHQGDDEWIHGSSRSTGGALGWRAPHSLAMLGSIPRPRSPAH